jgi:RNA polymerase sigma-70 factor, ECF subfamily
MVPVVVAEEAFRSSEGPFHRDKVAAGLGRTRRWAQVMSAGRRDGEHIAEKARHEEDPDWDLLRRIAAGDGEAFTLLVEKHQEAMLRVCERLLHDPEEARDVAQEVFLQVFRKAAGFRPRARVSTWLYRIAVNRSLNRLRRRKVVRMISFGALGGGEVAEEEGPAWDPPGETPDPLRALESRRRWAAVRRAIDGLPESQRAVLVLARFEGLSYKEIAEVMEITVGAVESRLVRAMRRLERSLAEPQENGRWRVSKDGRR